MTYQDDPKTPARRSHPMTQDASYTGWIVGGVVALVVIIGLFTLMGTSTDRTGTAANPPATTGAATPNALPPKAPATPAPGNTVPPVQSR